MIEVFTKENCPNCLVLKNILNNAVPEEERQKLLFKKFEDYPLEYFTDKGISSMPVMISDNDILVFPSRVAPNTVLEFVRNH